MLKYERELHCGNSALVRKYLRRRMEQPVGCFTSHWMDRGGVRYFFASNLIVKLYTSYFTLKFKLRRSSMIKRQRNWTYAEFPWYTYQSSQGKLLGQRTSLKTELLMPSWFLIPMALTVCVVYPVTHSFSSATPHCRLRSPCIHPSLLVLHRSALGSLGSLLEMLNCRPHPGPTESESSF